MFSRWIFLPVFLFCSPCPGFAAHILRAIWGDPAEDLTFIPDMYTFHIPALNPKRSYNNNNNPTLAVSYKGFFAGTFVNSFDIQTYAIGFQRYWLQRHPTPNFSYQLGFRLGLMYGYQHTGLMSGIPGLSWLRRNSPIFPAAEIIFDTTYRHVGFEFAWVDVALTGSIYVRI